MAKMYTLDKKLLTEKPEIRIGDKCYPVDDRTSTVKKLMKDLRAVDENSTEMLDSDEMIIKAAFNKNAKEILNMGLSYQAQTALAKMAMAAMTGEDDDSDSDRFQESEKESD